MKTIDSQMALHLQTKEGRKEIQKRAKECKKKFKATYKQLWKDDKTIDRFDLLFLSYCSMFEVAVDARTSESRLQSETDGVLDLASMRQVLKDLSVERYASIYQRQKDALGKKREVRERGEMEEERGREELEKTEETLNKVQDGGRRNNLKLKNKEMGGVLPVGDEIDEQAKFKKHREEKAKRLAVEAEQEQKSREARQLKEQSRDKRKEQEAQSEYYVMSEEEMKRFDRQGTGHLKSRVVLKWLKKAKLSTKWGAAEDNGEVVDIDEVLLESEEGGGGVERRMRRVRKRRLSLNRDRNHHQSCRKSTRRSKPIKSASRQDSLEPSTAAATPGRPGPT